MQRPQQAGGCWHSGRACEASFCPTACKHLCSSCFQAAGMRYCARSHQQQIAAKPPCLAWQNEAFPMQGSCAGAELIIGLLPGTQ